MFTYKGPRRVKVVGVWDKEALNASMPVEDYGLNSLKGAHIIVTTPEYLEPLAARGHVPLSNARVVVVEDDVLAHARPEQRGVARVAHRALAPLAVPALLVQLLVAQRRTSVAHGMRHHGG